MCLVVNLVWPRATLAELGNGALFDAAVADVRENAHTNFSSFSNIRAVRCFCFFFFFRLPLFAAATTSNHHFLLLKPSFFFVKKKTASRSDPSFLVFRRIQSKTRSVQSIDYWVFTEFCSEAVHRSSDRRVFLLIEADQRGPFVDAAPRHSINESMTVRLKQKGDQILTAAPCFLTLSTMMFSC